MKKFLTFLGTGNYKEAAYSLNGKVETSEYIQEAIIKLIESEQIEEIVFFLTEGARQKHWPILRDRLLQIPNLTVKEYPIYDGKDSSEIWKNFQIMVDAIEEEDKLYIDITHSFRSIPVLLMAMLNYVISIKSVDVIDIFYGAFEAQDENNIAPVFSLIQYNEIISWTKATDTFLETGNAFYLNKMIQKSTSVRLRNTAGNDQYARALKRFAKALSDFSSALYSIRSKEIYNSLHAIDQAIKDLDNFLEEAQKASDELLPFVLVYPQIKENFQNINNNFTEMMHKSVLMAVRFGLYPQALTLFNENIINYVIDELDLLEKKQDEVINEADSLYHNRLLREFISSYLTDNENEEFSDFGITQEHHQFLKTRLSQELKHLYQSEISTSRNDINHAGFRENAMNPHRLEQRLNSILDKFENTEVIQDLANTTINKEDKYRKVGLLFSHELTKKQREELEDRYNVKEIIELPSELQSKWENIPSELECLDEFLEDFKMWTNSNLNKDDVIIIQGEMGASFKMVDYAKDRGLISLYATTKRVHKEFKENDSIKIIKEFRHVRFREY